jgi:hypothetical protein
VLGEGTSFGSGGDTLGGDVYAHEFIIEFFLFELFEFFTEFIFVDGIA